MMLEPRERDRFVMWLEQNATSSAQLAEQMDKMSGAPFQLMAKKHRAEAAASQIVAGILKSMQFETLS